MSLANTLRTDECYVAMSIQRRKSRQAFELIDLLATNAVKVEVSEYLWLFLRQPAQMNERAHNGFVLPVPDMLEYAQGCRKSILRKALIHRKSRDIISILVDLQILGTCLDPVEK